MKKIVALALCLVLALSLCATAFAASTTGSEKTESIDIDDVTLYLKGSDGFYAKETLDTNTDKVEKWTHEDDVSSKGVHTVYAAEYRITSTAGSYAGTYFVVSKDAADSKIVVAGKTFYTLKSAVSTGHLSTSDVVTKKVDKDSDLNCGAYISAPNTAVAAYIVDGDAYEANATGNWALYNKEFVEYGTAVLDTQEHTFLAKNVSYNTKGDPVSVKCDKCNKTFNVIDKDDKDADKSASYYQDLGITGLADYTAVVGTAGSTPTTSGSKVDSAKTFDAGIALYVGMSISAVAGSAVVIGKKKEF